MDSRKVAEEYRLSHWAGIMRERQESGLSNKAYCKQSGLQESTFYYWQRKLREVACEELERYQNNDLQENLPVQRFAEVRIARPIASTGEAEAGGGSRVQVEAGGLLVMADSGYPVGKLAKLLRELTGPC